MFVQGTSANIKVSVKANTEEAVDTLKNAKVYIYLRRKKIVKRIECEILDSMNGIAIARLDKEVLKESGNYDYQIKIEYKNGVVKKSAMGSFYVAPGIEIEE